MEILTSQYCMSCKVIFCVVSEFKIIKMYEHISDPFGFLHKSSKINVKFKKIIIIFMARLFFIYPKNYKIDLLPAELVYGFNVITLSSCIDVHFLYVNETKKISEKKL